MKRIGNHDDEDSDIEMLNENQMSSIPANLDFLIHSLSTDENNLLFEFQNKGSDYFYPLFNDDKQRILYKLISQQYVQNKAIADTLH